MRNTFRLQNLKLRDYCEDPDLDGNVMLTRNSKLYGKCAMDLGRGSGRVF